MTTYDLGNSLPDDAGRSPDVDAHLAASAIILRGDPFEVLLIRRHERSSFLPGSWVFPRGRTEEQDRRENHLATMKACAIRKIREGTGIAIESPGALVWAARWITPVGAPSRFDTDFFLGLAPEGAIATADQTERSRSCAAGR